MTRTTTMLDETTLQIVEKRCDDLVTQVESIENQIKNSIRPTIKSLISSTETIPLDVRWRLYTRLPAHYFDACDTQTFDVLEELGMHWYDNFYVDKYKTVDNRNIMERFEEIRSEGRAEHWSSDGSIITDEHIARLKEEMMQSGCREWTHDW